MTVASIVSRLDTQVPALAQVIAATPGGSQSPYDTSTALVSLLKSTVSNRMHPVTIRDANAHPSIVYQMVSSTASRMDGFRVTQTDTFVLYVRHTSYDSLITVVNSIITAIDSAVGSIEVTDMMFDFDDDQAAYRCNLEIQYTYVVAAAQTLPAAYVYQVDRQADESPYDNFIKQRVTNSYAIVLVTNSNASPIITLDSLRASVQGALLGWAVSATSNEFQYREGSSIEGVGGLEMWREIYFDSEYISQS